ncbi:5-(carboxyamino)imidazole ribonucleotide synthase [Euzebya sp.]|uniref:5-(carboxyamino)imidazole ribonucleotide synthase n=1 Tax=Euzebya sp. TaxID=1971409 RepID=UPI0035173EF9
MSTALGIVGGGQLARMTALDAARLGVDVRVLAGPSDEGVRGVFEVVDGDHDDLAALRRLAEQVDVVTFDHELVPLDVVRALEADGVVVRPGSPALAFADKVHQRRAFLAAGLPLPAFDVVADLPGVEAFAATHGWPVVLKAPHGGYDGRGVAIAGSPAEARDMVEASAGRGVLVEAHLDLQAELAVLVVTSADGSRVVYDPVRSVQVDGMCREVHAVAGHLPPILAAEAGDLGREVADLVGAVGVLAIELFVVAAPDGTQRLVVNEIAPRPHNSGHHTIDGCATSQFENHARAVLGWPLGPVTPRATASVMVNVVGTAGDPRDRVHLVDPAVKIHLYDKSPRPGRKIGHVTAVGTDHDETAAAARRAAAVLEGEQP